MIVFILTKTIRPYFSDILILNITLGSIPNLIGAFVYSSIVKEFALKKQFKTGLIIMLINALVVILLLIKEEIYPQFTDSKTFDYYDIFFSILGCIIAILMFLYEYKKIETDNHGY